MRWDTKRYITELFIGFLVVGMVAGMLIFREYETYLHYLSIEAQLIASDDPKEEVFQILKEGETMGSDKGREILKKYGYETAADNREGVRMMKNSVWIAGGAFVVWLGFAVILYFEKRRNRQENLTQSRKVSEWLVRIREGYTVRISCIGMRKMKWTTGFWMSWNLLEAMWKWWKSRRTRKKKRQKRLSPIFPISLKLR
ncbi:MAG: hypothetical protein ACLRHQ_01950 [Sellimonas intestinalis]|uniref:hypothetical protein n=1 Tax=Sellimonas intestinalis TaxID=1653434 RepID=UPI0039A2B9C8